MDPVVIAAAIAAVPATVAAAATVWNGRRQKRIEHHAVAINDSVNHRHPGEPRLLDLARVAAQFAELNHQQIVMLDQRLDEHIAQHRDAGCPMMSDD